MTGSGITHYHNLKIPNAISPVNSFSNIFKLSPSFQFGPHCTFLSVQITLNDVLIGFPAQTSIKTRLAQKGLKSLINSRKTQVYICGVKPIKATEWFTSYIQSDEIRVFNFHCDNETEEKTETTDREGKGGLKRKWGHHQRSIQSFSHVCSMYVLVINTCLNVIKLWGYWQEVNSLATCGSLYKYSVRMCLCLRGC